MRTRTILFAVGLIGASLAFVAIGPSRGAVAQGSAVAPAFVKLQPTSPGTAQTGNVNVTGTVLGGQFAGGGAGLTSVNADRLDGKDSTEFLGIPANVVTNISGTVLSVENVGPGRVALFNNTSTASGGLASEHHAVRGLSLYAWKAGNDERDVAYFWNAGVAGGRGVHIETNLNAGDALFAETSSPNLAGNFRGLNVNSRGVMVSTAGGAALQVTGGSKNAVVPTHDGARAVSCEESTEVWFTDYGFGRLRGGIADVAIDPRFADTVSLDRPYHVFVQVDDPGCAGVAVTRKGMSSFRVTELSSGRSDSGFSYRIVAKRRGFEADRLTRAPWADHDPHLNARIPLMRRP